MNEIYKLEVAQHGVALFTTQDMSYAQAVATYRQLKGRLPIGDGFAIGVTNVRTHELDATATFNNLGAGRTG